jgi:hypothetical protein
MKNILVVLACLVPVLVQAEVYRWVDEQGRIHFGDLPPERRSAETVDLPRRSPPPVTRDASDGKRAEPSVPATNEAGTDGVSSGYQQLAIIQPATGSTVRSNEQTLMVVTSLEPSLRAGHLMALYLDGTAVGPGVPGTSVELHGIVRGRHSLQAKVVDAKGEVIIESPVVNFYLRQAAVAPAN